MITVTWEKVKPKLQQRLEIYRIINVIIMLIINDFLCIKKYSFYIQSNDKGEGARHLMLM